jgi:Putative prokaryotic signal transducing protein
VTPEFGTEPVVVAVVANEVEAEIACGLLRTEGIRCFHRLTDIAAAGFAEGALGSGGFREVLAPASDAERARILLTSGP